MTKDMVHAEQLFGSPHVAVFYLLSVKRKTYYMITLMDRYTWQASTPPTVPFMLPTLTSR